MPQIFLRSAPGQRPPRPGTRLVFWKRICTFLPLATMMAIIALEKSRLNVVLPPPTVQHNQRRLLDVDSVKDRISEPNDIVGWHKWCESVQKPYISESPTAYQWADKLVAKQRIQELVPNIKLAKVFASVDKAKKIKEEFVESLPQEGYLMKASHYSGGIILVKDNVPKCLKEPCMPLENYNSTRDYLRSTCHSYFRTKYGMKKGELWYEKITPQCFFEELLPIDESADFRDYKVHFMNGKPVFVQIDAARFKKHQRTWVTPFSFREIPMTEEGRYGYPPIDEIGLKPDFFDDLVQNAATIASAVDEPYVRIDFFAFKNSYVFAEVSGFRCIHGPLDNS